MVARVRIYISSSASFAVAILAKRNSLIRAAAPAAVLSDRLRPPCGCCLQCLPAAGAAAAVVPVSQDGVAGGGGSVDAHAPACVPASFFRFVRT